MDIQSQPIQVALLSGISGMIGYGFREWMNHAHPFLVITKFEGDFQNDSTEVPIPEKITSSLKSAAIIDSLNEKETIEKIRKAFRKSKEVQENSPKIIRRIDNMISAIKASSSDDSLCEIMADIHDIGVIDEYIIKLIFQDRIKIPQLSNGVTEKKVSIDESTENGGCVILGFPGRPVTLGWNFNKDSYTKKLFQPMTLLIQHLDRNNLSVVYEAIKLQLVSELSIANEVQGKLEKILDLYSTWEVQVFFGNLRSTPILIEKNATLFVEDKTGARFKEECTLVLREKDQDGNTIRRVADTPIVVPSGSHLSCSFFTKQTQREMTRGDAFRETFTNKQAKAWLIINIQGIGLIRQRAIKTNTIQFQEDN